MSANESPSHLVVGRLGKPHGLRGEIYVEVESDDETRFAPGSAVLLDGDLSPLTLRTFRRHHDRTLVTFDGVEDLTGAEALRGRDLLVPVEQARTLGPDEYWDHELVGCLVLTTEGEEVGEVAGVLHYPANDVLEVGDHLIPLVRAVVREVDPAGKRVVVEPIPGLLGD